MTTINTIGKKILFCFLIIGLGYIAVFSFITLNVVTNYNNRLSKRNLIRWANDVESIMEPNFYYFNYNNLSSQSEEILKDKEDDFIFLYDAKGKEFFFKGPDSIKVNFHLPKIGGNMELRKLDISDKPYYLICMPVKISGSDAVWGYIFFGISLYENNRIITNLRNFIILISIILMSLAATALVIFTKKLTHPIEALKLGLEKISRGNFSHRIRIDSNDEFSFLGNQFNEMAERIESMMSEIEASQKDLENQVFLRTRELNESNQKLKIAMQELQDTQTHIIQAEKQKSLTAIVSGFAHEINNPLAGILGYVDLMVMRADTSPYVKEKLTNIQNQALRIKTIIEELNQLNPESEQAKMEINLPNLLEKLMKVVTSKPENQNIVFEKNHFEEEAIIYGNHFSLWQVFDSIIENSIEAIRESEIKNGKIAIVVKKSMDGHHAIVDIIDNGGGFRNIEKAYDPFYTTKSRIQKKGIGLSIVYNIIQEHSGNILISNNENNGATVSVYLILRSKGSKET